MIVSWFSAGVSSAVATKLAIDRIDRIIYTHIEDQHPDTLRFVSDCALWFGKPVEITQSPLKNVENACLAAGGRGYINGPQGAACTRLLKRKLRMRFEYDLAQDIPLTYVWGMDSTESLRCLRLQSSMPNMEHLFPLVAQGIDKVKAHQILKASGIERPKMYALGYPNNNCIGCVKGGKGYWNRIRRDFPEVFSARASLERRIGNSCIKGVFLDELCPSEGRFEAPIVEDCGIFCDLLSLE